MFHRNRDALLLRVNKGGASRQGHEKNPIAESQCQTTACAAVFLLGQHMRHNSSKAQAGNAQVTSALGLEFCIGSADYVPEHCGPEVGDQMDGSSHSAELSAGTQSHSFPLLPPLTASLPSSTPPNLLPVPSSLGLTLPVLRPCASAAHCIIKIDLGT